MPAKTATKTSAKTTSEKSVTFKSLGLTNGRNSDVKLNWCSIATWFSSPTARYSNEFIIVGGFGFHDKTNDVDKVALALREPGSTEIWHTSFPDNEERSQLLEVVNLVCGKQKKEITNLCLERIPGKYAQPYVRVISTDDVDPDNDTIETSEEVATDDDIPY